MNGLFASVLPGSSSVETLDVYRDAVYFLGP